MIEAILVKGVASLESSVREKITETPVDLSQSDDISSIDELRLTLAKGSQTVDELLHGAREISRTGLGGADQSEDAVCAIILAYGDRLAMAGLIDRLPSTEEALNG